jgi:fibronectin-binding autotransporter adhesin
MTGGTMNIYNPNASGGIWIGSSQGYYSVTGGVINAYVPAAATNFTIRSTAPLPTLNVYKDGAGTGTALFASNITILNDLSTNTNATAANSPTLNCAGFNLTVGGNVNIQASTSLITGANTITLNGSGTHLLTNNGTINQTAASNPAVLNNVVVNKTGTVTLAGANNFPGSSTVTNGSITTLTLTSGTLNDGGKTVNVSTNLTNNATHASTGTGSITYTRNVASTISGSNGTFGNLTLSNTAAAGILISTNGAQTITGNLRITNAFTSLSIGSNSLTVEGGIFTNGGIGELCRGLISCSRSEQGHFTRLRPSQFPLPGWALSR